MLRINAAVTMLPFMHLLWHAGAQPSLDIDVAVGDHLFRSGHVIAGRALIAALPPSQARLVDAEPLSEIDGCIEALRRREIQPALAWVHDNASRLRRMDSSLEFVLRKQEFVELLRTGRKSEAMELASAHLAPAAQALSSAATSGAAPTSRQISGETTGGHGAASGSSTAGGAGAAGGSQHSHAGNRGGNGASLSRDTPGRPTVMLQLQTAMSALAFPDPPSCGVPEIQELFHQSAWDGLCSAFKTEAFAAIGVPRQSHLEAAVAVGLTALKTAACKQDHGHHRFSRSAFNGGAAASRGRRTTAEHGPSAAAGSDADLDGTTEEEDGIADGDGTCRASHRHGYVAAGIGACPACAPGYFASTLARAPMARRSVSHLICPITKVQMNEHDPPVVLPNGRMYATSTVKMLTSEDGSRVLCPRTGEVFPASEVRKAYVV